MVRPSQRNYVTSTNTLCPSKTQRNSKKHKGSRPSDSKNAARERCRVENLRHAFVALQQCLPSVPPDTKLSKLDVLILATTYIAHLARILDTENGMGVLSTDFDLFEGTMVPPPEPLEVKNPNWEKSYLHPVRKWPMRSRLYAGVEDAESSSSDVGLSTSLFHRALWS